MSRDYTKEIGNRSTAPRVPMPIAIGLLAIAGAALWFGAVKIGAIPSSQPAAEAAKPAVAAQPTTHAQSTPR